jgi:hypothetical protein
MTFSCGAALALACAIPLKEGNAIAASIASPIKPDFNFALG